MENESLSSPESNNEKPAADRFFRFLLSAGVVSAFIVFCYALFYFFNNPGA